ncbi:MAG: YiiX/YebB-like N1pC/P60 family cysteine hydrolase [Fibrobacterota bacterium]
MGRTHYGLSERPRFVTRACIDNLRTLLEPGDIILIRRNWVLSNIGLPGFWPHAALYTGTSAEAASRFTDDTALVGALRDTGRAGEPLRTVEALANGVVRNTLEKTCDADYVAVLRPRIPDKDKAAALRRALSCCGVPYDFDFDFSTDASLVCTELIYKAYQRGAGMEQGLSLPLSDILGRLTLPPNDFAELFAQERGLEGRQFDFVAFVDGNGNTGQPLFSPETAFVESRQRVKWDFLLE